MYVHLLKERLTISDKGLAIINLVKCKTYGIPSGPIAFPELSSFIMQIISFESVGFIKKIFSFFFFKNL